MPAVFVVPMITPDVRRHEPLHPAAQVSILMRPQQQMKMVCHQTKPRQPHRHLLVSLQHQVDKRGEVVILVKDVTLAIAPVQDMVNKTASRCSGCSWHEHRLTAVVTRVKQNVPFCDSTICEIMLYVGWDQRSAGPPFVRSGGPALRWSHPTKTAFVVPMITPDVRRHEPLHPAAQVSILMRPQQQVKMVCHQTKPCQPLRHFLVSLPHQVHKRSEVVIFVKDVTPELTLRAAAHFQPR